MAYSQDDRRVLSLQLAERVNVEDSSDLSAATAAAATGLANRLHINEQLSTLADESTTNLSAGKSASTSHRSFINNNNNNNTNNNNSNKLNEKSASMWNTNNQLNQLETASKASSEWKDYKSGVIFTGELKDNLKSGQGVFVWPNGDKYVGEFETNRRNGQGCQTWSDTSYYKGSFCDDKRNGRGLHKWANGDVRNEERTRPDTIYYLLHVLFLFLFKQYEGDWMHDFRHGFGTYSWSDDQSVYTGLFFSNHREGYGKLSFANGNLFVGLYKHDRRFGPGLLTYHSSSTQQQQQQQQQDVGYWMGDQIVRLLVPVSGVDFKFFADAAESGRLKKHVELRSPYDRESLLDDTLNPQNIFMRRVRSSKENHFIKNDPYVEKLLKKNFRLHDEYFEALWRYALGAAVAAVGNIDAKTKLLVEEKRQQFRGTRVVHVDNTTPALLELFKHTRRNDTFAGQLSVALNFDLANFERGKRDAFAPPGVLETCALDMLNACAENNLDKMSALKHLVSLDVCDNRGYSPLIIAVVSVKFSHKHKRWNMMSCEKREKQIYKLCI